MRFRVNFKSIIYLLVSILIMYIYYSGIIMKLVHPRMHIVILISSFVFFLFFIIESMKDNHNHSCECEHNHDEHNKIKLFSILYAMPVILVFFINAGDLSNTAIRNKGINVGKNMEIRKITDSEKDKASTAKINYDDAIIMTDKNYIDTIDEVGLYLNEYVGKTIVIRGLIYRDDTMKKGQFVIGRLAMTCCSADASLVGFLSTYKDYDDLKDNEWYEATAIVDQVQYDGIAIAYLNIKKISKIDKPSDEYVF